MLNKVGIIHVRSTKRNTVCSLVDLNDRKVKFSRSLGCLKDASVEKRNHYTSVRLLSRLFVQKIKELGYGNVSVILRGLGPGRAAVINCIREHELRVGLIKDLTSSAHNGCRPPKTRRKKFRTRTSFRIRRILSPGA